MTHRAHVGDAAWVAHWLRVGPVLEKVRCDELRHFRHEDHVEAIDALLRIGVERAVPRETSGLVEQQRLFHMQRR